MAESKMNPVSVIRRGVVNRVGQNYTVHMIPAAWGREGVQPREKIGAARHVN
jgi:hypothetical protein